MQNTSIEVALAKIPSISAPNIARSDTFNQPPLKDADLSLPIQIDLVDQFEPSTAANIPPVETNLRPSRERRLPVRYRPVEDVLPQGPGPLELSKDFVQQEAIDHSALDPVQDPTNFQSYPQSRVHRTIPNAFGVFRQYNYPPLSIPDLHLSLRDLPPNPLVNDSTINIERAPGSRDDQNPNTHQHIYHPLPNGASFHFLQYLHSGGSKSKADTMRLLAMFELPQYRFQPLDFKEISQRGNVNNLEALIDSHAENGDFLSAPWKESEVTLRIPIPRRRGDPLPKDLSELSKIYQIPGLQHRSIVQVVRSILVQPQAGHAAIHYQPFFSLRKAPTTNDPNHVERMFDELYSSNAWMREDEAIQHTIERDKNGDICTLPKAIAGLMFASDATQLANFGTQKLWPLYMFLGNQSLWYRGQPSTKCCHHIAYFKSVRIELLQ